jgi:hypothetical protein
MSSNQSSEENVESPSTYGKEAYVEYKKKEKRSKNSNLMSHIYNGSEITELNFIHR